MRISVIFFTLFLAGTLGAQDVELVVTATKQPTDERVLTVPVTIVDPGLSDAVDLAQLLSGAPGVNVQTQVPGQPTLAAESFGNNGFARINFLVDGVSLNRPDMSGVPLSILPLLAIDHVEILNAPGSALYGDQSIMGAVNVVTKVPTKVTFSALGSVDQNGGSDLSLFAGLPFVWGGLLLSADRDQTESSRTRSESTNWNLWSKLTLDPLPKQKVTLTASYGHDSADLPGSLNAAELAANPDQVESWYSSNESTTVSTRLSGQWDYSGEGTRATVPLSYQSRDINVFYSAGTDYRLFQFASEPNVRMLFQGVVGGDLTAALAFGGNYEQLEVNSYADLAENTLNTAATIKRMGGHGWISLQQDWGSFVVTGVGRYETSTTEASSVQQPSLDNHQTFPSVTYSTGVAWIPDDASKVAFNLGSVSRYPFTDEMANYYYGTFAFNTSLRPETGTTAELSGTTSLGLLLVTIRGSVTALQDEIAFSNSDLANVNLDPTLHWVGDLDLATKPVTWGVLPGSTVLGAEYTLTRAVFASGSYRGNDLPLVPVHKVKGSISYSPVDFLKVSSDGTYTSGYFLDSDFGNSYGQEPGKLTLNADLSFSLPVAREWTFTVYGHNLSNDRTPDYAGEVSGVGSYYPTSGRTLGATVKAVY